MSDESSEAFVLLLDESCRELRAGGSRLSSLLEVVESLASVARSGAVDQAALDRAEQAFAAFPELQPARGGRRATGTLPATSRVLMEIQNRLTILEEERRR